MNNIDVSKCIHKYYVDGEQICGIYESDYVECSKENCYYKQLQQSKAENEELRKEMQGEVNASQKWYQLHTHEKFRAEKYKQCLDRIEEICKPICKIPDRSCGVKNVYEDSEDLVPQILQKIKEVKGNE